MIKEKSRADVRYRMAVPGTLLLNGLIYELGKITLPTSKCITFINTWMA